MDPIYNNLSPGDGRFDKDRRDRSAAMSLRILVADDERLAARLLAENFEDAGFETATVFSARDAIDYIEKNRPDLVFLDVNFNAEATGMDVLRRVMTSAPETRICLMSGYREERRAEGMALGAVAFIGKPAAMEDYMKVARAAAQSLRQGRGSP